MSPRVKLPVWTLEDALLLIHELQPLLWKLHHHVALGGGVLNAGTSHKDLDLYILPFGDSETASFKADVDALLMSFMEWEAPIGDSETYGQQPAMRARDRYTYNDKRVDVFVVKG